jgi:hypothetical protein
MNIPEFNSVKDLIDLMRKTKPIFGKFARGKFLIQGVAGEQFQREIIRAYSSFVDAIDVAIDHYNETEPDKMLLFDEPRNSIP